MRIRALANQQIKFAHVMAVICARKRSVHLLSGCGHRLTPAAYGNSKGVGDMGQLNLSAVRMPRFVIVCAGYNLNFGDGAYLSQERSAYLSAQSKSCGYKFIKVYFYEFGFRRYINLSAVCSTYNKSEPSIKSGLNFNDTGYRPYINLSPAIRIYIKCWAMIKPGLNFKYSGDRFIRPFKIISHKIFRLIECAIIAPGHRAYLRILATGRLMQIIASHMGVSARHRASSLASYYLATVSGGEGGFNG
jgi:hypothetical protein